MEVYEKTRNFKKTPLQILRYQLIWFLGFFFSLGEFSQIVVRKLVHLLLYLHIFLLWYPQNAGLNENFQCFIVRYLRHLQP